MLWLVEVSIKCHEYYKGVSSLEDSFWWQMPSKTQKKKIFLGHKNPLSLSHGLPELLLLCSWWRWCGFFLPWPGLFPVVSFFVQMEVHPYSTAHMYVTIIFIPLHYSEGRGWKCNDSQKTLFAVSYNIELNKSDIILKTTEDVPEKKNPEVASDKLLDFPSKLPCIPLWNMNFIYR